MPHHWPRILVGYGVALLLHAVENTTLAERIRRISAALPGKLCHATAVPTTLLPSARTARTADRAVVVRYHQPHIVGVAFVGASARQTDPSRGDNRMRLIRGCEKQFLPSETGGVWLSKASVYRRIGEEDGVGDRREGEVRKKEEGGHLSVEWEPRDGLPPALRSAIEKHEGSAAETEEFRALLAARDDDPDLALQRIGRGEWTTSQNVVVNDDEIASPYLLCLAREPTTREEWERLRAALPERYDAWTVTADIDALQFEIECGIKRWLATERITRYRIERASGWVTYPFDDAPPSGDPTEVFRMSRWFRKRTKYQAQAEYRLAWSLSSDQRVDMPETIDAELTRTGLRLFEPWTPSSG